MDYRNKALPNSVCPVMVMGAVSELQPVLLQPRRWFLNPLPVLLCPKGLFVYPSVLSITVLPDSQWWFSSPSAPPWWAYAPPWLPAMLAPPRLSGLPSGSRPSSATHAWPAIPPPGPPLFHLPSGFCHSLQLVCPRWPPEDTVFCVSTWVFVCAPVYCLTPPILLPHYCFSGSTCVSFVTLVCLPILCPSVCSPVLVCYLSFIRTCIVSTIVGYVYTAYLDHDLPCHVVPCPGRSACFLPWVSFC